MGKRTVVARIYQNAAVPVYVKGPAHDRINAAHDGAHQSFVLLSEALDQLSGGFDEKQFVLRALVSRAKALAEATGLLLSVNDGEDETDLNRAFAEVRHG